MKLYALLIMLWQDETENFFFNFLQVFVLGLGRTQKLPIIKLRGTQKLTFFCWCMTQIFHIYIYIYLYIELGNDI